MYLKFSHTACKARNSYNGCVFITTMDSLQLKCHGGYNKDDDDDDNDNDDDIVLRLHKTSELEILSSAEIDTELNYCQVLYGDERM
jgi:hypothetical protein